jgi:hypothetical protein
LELAIFTLISNGVVAEGITLLKSISPLSDSNSAFVRLTTFVLPEVKFNVSVPFEGEEEIVSVQPAKVAEFCLN